MSRLTECDICGGLASLAAERPIYDDGLLTPNRRSAQITAYEEDVDCPKCGPRTQVVSIEDCPA